MHKPGSKTRRRGRKFGAFVFGAALLSFFAGCGAVDKTPPSVLTTTPTNGAAGTLVDQTIAVRFSESVVASSINIQLLDASSTVVLSTVIKTADSASISPLRPLDFESSYKVIVQKGALDLSGNAMPTDYVFKFTTSAKNSAFVKGAVLADSFIRRVWGSSSFNPQAQLYGAGLHWARIGVTTQSYSVLQTTSAASWSSIPFQSGSGRAGKWRAKCSRRPKAPGASSTHSFS